MNFIFLGYEVPVPTGERLEEGPLLVQTEGQPEACGRAGWGRESVPGQEG